MESTRDLLEKYSLKREEIIEKIMSSPEVEKEIKEIVHMINEILSSSFPSLEEKFYFLKIGSFFRKLYENETEINKYYTIRLKEKCIEIICKNLHECEKKCSKFSKSVNEYRRKVWEDRTIEICKNFF
ncbi:hypothetical protein SJAV_26000 [Sulfurisphaera javensis]|uniref:Uncharacterized protein n=1 Tax=Sulfurisphaera javensis TaxID=2049879 RepID=A0AAT9GVB3_9CREN